MTIVRCLFMLLTALVGGCSLFAAETGPDAVAVFVEPHFPYYMSDSNLSPNRVVRWLRGVGVDAQPLSAAQLADPQVFNAERFGVLVHVYGNTYPQPPFDNIRAFHQAGGCLLMAGGTPFCHPCVPGGAKGWDFGESPEDVMVRDADVAHSGQASLRLVAQKKEDWFGPSTQRLPTEGGQAYTAGAWVRTSADLAPDERSRLWIRAFDGADVFCGQGGPTIPEPDSDWTWVEESFTIPGNAATMDFSIQFWCTAGTVWIDDAVLSRGTTCDPDANLLENPGFEALPDKPNWTDLGHRDDFTHEKMGTGGFVWLDGIESQEYADPQDRLGLRAVPWDRSRSAGQYCILDPASLPEGDEAWGAVSVTKGAEEVGWPVAVIEHDCEQFRGAIDVLAGSNMIALLPREQQRHLITRSALYQLWKSGRMSDEARAQALVRLDELSPPGDFTRSPSIVREPKPFDTFFPRTPAPAGTLAVVNLDGEEQDARFVAVALQGLVNRDQPRIYVQSGLANSSEPTTEFWLSNLKSRGYQTRETASVADLVAEFAGDRQAVLYSEDLWEDDDRKPILNVIAAICGIRDLLPVTPALNETLGLPVAFDATAAWTSVREAYEWGMRELWPQANHHVLAFQHPEMIPFFDYLIACRVFPIAVFQDAPDDTEDIFEDMLRQTPPNIPVMGCWGRYGEQPPLAYLEHELVTLTSKWGKPFVVSQWGANLSVHSGVPVAPEELKQKPCATKTLDPEKVYVVLDYSDGDNLQYVQSTFFGSHWWGNEARGDVELAWSMGPGAADLMPDILAYYYATATPKDEFIAAVSGAGYCYLDVYAQEYGDGAGEVLDEFLTLTAETMQRGDLQVVNPVRGDREDYERYARLIPNLSGIIADYGKAPDLTYDEANYTVGDGRIPVFRNVACFDGRGDNIEKTVELIRAATPEQRPAFLHVFVINWWNTPADLVKVMEELGDDYEACTAGQFVDLWRQSRP